VAGDIEKRNFKLLNELVDTLPKLKGMADVRVSFLSYGWSGNDSGARTSGAGWPAAHPWRGPSTEALDRPADQPKIRGRSKHMPIAGPDVAFARFLRRREVDGVGCAQE
jgi:hypothetical protein